ncbi:MAG: hypothetical protein M3463_20045, partial [Verrucomicrobiota bacterium]|nr:hypothetical protein [Verrucomicrobiota bacterium]
MLTVKTTKKILTATLLLSSLLLGGRTAQAQTGYAVTASPTTVAPAGQITANWTAPAGRSPTDWVGLYRVGQPNEWFIAWKYTGGTASGSRNFTLPAEAGQYHVRYFLGNEYQ